MHRITQGARHKLWTVTLCSPHQFQINKTANTANQNIQLLTNGNFSFRSTNNMFWFQQSPNVSTNQNDSLVKATNHSLAFHPSRHVSTESVAADTEAKLQTENQGPNFDVKFDDFSTAFNKKSKWELIRALTVLWMCSFDCVADNALRIMSTSHKVLGRRVSEWLMKRTVYDQFVAGETPEEIHTVIRRHQDMNVGPLLAAPMEDDISSFQLDADTKFDENLDTIVNSMSLARDLDPVFPMIQMRITGLVPGDLCLALSERCPEPSSHPEVIESLASALRGQPLDIDQTFGAGLSDAMKQHLKRSVARLAEVCQVATEKEVMVMVDAEYTYINPALNLITLAMMIICNDAATRPPLIFYTYQNYLKKTREILERDLKYAESRRIGFAAKLVRGAYMYREKHVASTQGYPDPIQDSYDDTSRAYDAAVKLLLSKMAAKPGHYRLIVASHNEESVLSALKGLQELNIDPCGGEVFFGQIMGMADHISCSLGTSGFLVRKSLPYGPLSETLPYLSRRAQENRAVFLGARRERKLLKSELHRRFKRRPVA